MPKSKNRKNHKVKVANRNSKIEQQKKKLEKQKKEFIMNLIKQEQEKGMFDNTSTISPIDDQTSDLNIKNEGPSI
jgi:hypothetical protein